MNRGRAGLIAAVAGIAVGAVVATLVITRMDAENAPTDAAGLATIASSGSGQGLPYGGDPESEARLVQIEDERLAYVRTMASVALWSDIGTDGPYRLATGSTITLVLIARADPYTLADIALLAPDTVVGSDGEGTYLLSESIIVLEGASLDLSSDTDITIRMTSEPSRFVSIVTLGGSLTIAGTPESTVSIESWDAELGAPDTRTNDGRAYIRAIGGQASLSHAAFSNLGFWSGNTGGLALTGNDTVGTFDVGESAAVGDESDAGAAGALILPSGALSGFFTPTGSSPFVSAAIDTVTIDGNAFGLFVTGAVNVVVRSSMITDSLVDGLVFHRFVTDSSVTDTTSSNNAVDGFTLARSTTGVAFARVTASENGRNGISLDGQPLADGPSAVGTEVESYGGNTITDSTITGNDRYGIEVSGGRSIILSANTIALNQVGVMVNHGSDGAVITGNIFGRNDVQSVAVRDGVTDSLVSRNTFLGGDTAISVRNADVEVTGNVISTMSNHGVTIIGAAQLVTVAENTIAGFGTLPIYDEEAIGFTLGVNDVEGWHPAVTPESVLQSVSQPLTIVWLVLVLVLLATALRPRSSRFGTIRHPYPDHEPLQSISRGIAARHALREAAE